MTQRPRVFRPPRAAQAAAVLLDHQLPEMMLFLALPRRDTEPMAHALTRRFGGFADAIAAPSAELEAVQGLGGAGAAALKAVEAAAPRLTRVAAGERPVLNNWRRLVVYLTAALAREWAEQVLFLDARNLLLADGAQGRGTVNRMPVYPREVVRRALAVGATAPILIHNHPSDEPTPSKADVEVAAEVKAAAVFGIALRDHLIVGRGRHVSLRREGVL